MKRWSLRSDVSVFAIACSGRASARPLQRPDQPVRLPWLRRARVIPAARTAAVQRGSDSSGDGFGHVKFRQEQDATHNVINLDVWVRDLLANTSYSLQRATDATLDGVCTGTNWLTLGEGSTPHPIVTDDRAPPAPRCGVTCLPSLRARHSTFTSA